MFDIFSSKCNKISKYNSETRHENRLIEKSNSTEKIIKKIKSTPLTNGTHSQKNSKRIIIQFSL